MFAYVGLPQNLKDLKDDEPRFSWTGLEIGQSQLAGLVGIAAQGFELLDRNVQWFRRRLVFEAHTFDHHSTVGLRVLKQKEKGSSTFR